MEIVKIIGDTITGESYDLDQKYDEQVRKFIQYLLNNTKRVMMCEPQYLFDSDVLPDVVDDLVCDGLGDKNEFKELIKNMFTLIVLDERTQILKGVNK